ncbi:BQ5605_C037g11631 [Microbotryum silenes-dioicae]|uniref:BQ5605_C037g11631 protein n=1 Tax=Microbotryum silenes-dioicae TaxID=796604 RepID=A0A2X0MJP7_9BASI|nr:BQ5605_C037g11631 [Microbotryum silenes-dioicae]
MLDTTLAKSWLQSLLELPGTANAHHLLTRPHSSSPSSLPRFLPFGLLPFLVPVSFQALLLHPIFPRAISTPARLLLLPLGLYYAARLSFEYGFEPREASVGVNFGVVGVMGAYAIMKSECLADLEFHRAAEGCAGLITFNIPYAALEFAFDIPVNTLAETSSKHGHGKPSNVDPTRQRKEQLEALRRKAAENDSPVQILSWTLHLLVSMRGIGWAFGPPPRCSARPHPMSHAKYLRRVLLDLVWSHCTLVTCSYIILTPHSTRASAIARHFPSLSVARVESLAFSCAALSLGVAAVAGLTLGFTCVSLMLFTLTGLLRTILPVRLRPPPFDPRQYPRLFQIRLPTSVAKFWSEQWHYFFARPFKVLGYEPTMAIVSPILGKTIAQAAAVMAVFAISAWLHEHALWSALHTFHISNPAHLPWTTRWGSVIYFLSQGVGVVVEGAFTSMTKRKVGKTLGAVWTLFWIAGPGVLLSSCWLEMGIAQGIPRPQHWQGPWRYVLPIATLYPGPLWSTQ